MFIIAYNALGGGLVGSSRLPVKQPKTAVTKTVTVDGER